MTDNDYAFEMETDGVIVRVTPRFEDDDSIPENHQFCWTYQVEVENHTQETLKLTNRHWRIVDQRGFTHAVDGEGILGEQPVLTPGSALRYSSGAPLSSPSGIMSGAYEFLAEDGSERVALIPAFPLDSPYDLAEPN